MRTAFRSIQRRSLTFGKNRGVSDAVKNFLLTFTLFIIAVIIIASFSSCGQNSNKSGDPTNDFDPASPFPVFRKVAREARDDGWVYTFVYADYKDKNADNSGIFKYRFFGINLRRKYDENYIQKIVHEPEDPDRGSTYTEIVYPSILVAGRGPAAESRDMALINNTILDNSKSVEELLALDPDDYEFESVDKEMFFRLMRTALTGEPQKEGTDQAYWDKPTFALMIEPVYLSGYKFQVAFLNETGSVDEMYIDVLYQTGNGYTDYVQLSDLAESGSATEEQMQAFEKIREIADGIKENDSYFANADEWRDLQIAGIDFSRLYTFFEKLYKNDYSAYLEEPYSEIIEGIAQT